MTNFNTIFELYKELYDIQELNETILDDLEYYMIKDAEKLSTIINCSKDLHFFDNTDLINHQLTKSFLFFNKNMGRHMPNKKDIKNFIRTKKNNL